MASFTGSASASASSNKADLALNVRSKLATDLTKLNSDQQHAVIAERSLEVSRNISRSVKRDRLTQDQLSALKKIGSLTPAILNCKTSEELVAVMKILAPNFGEVDSKSSSIRYILAARGKLTALARENSTEAQALLRKDIFLLTLASIPELAKKYSLKTLMTFCLSTLKDFALNLRLCWVFNNMMVQYKLGDVPTAENVKRLQSQSPESVKVLLEEADLPI